MARKMRKFREGDFVSVSEELSGAPKRKLPGQSDYVSTESVTETVSDTTAKPKKQTFAEAFRAARARGDKTFSWAGKPGMKFTTEMAGQGASRSAATRRSAAETPKTAAKSGLKPETEKFLNSLRPAMYLNRKDKAFISDRVTPTKKSDYIPVSSLKSQSDKPAASAAKAEPKRDNTAAGRRARMVNAVKGLFGASDESRARYAAQQKKAAEMRAARKPLLLTGEEARKANKGTIGGKAKGGKIDGCAVRGKTRAGRK